MSAESKTKIAPYTTLVTAEDTRIELRNYDSMILVSAPMKSDDERNSAFRKLFKYISGENTAQSNIEMTAPVFMDEQKDQAGTKIPMTAPVFMDRENDKPMMSFVMPQGFTLETTPKPTSTDIVVSEVRDYTVAVIQFSGRLTDANTQKHKDILEQWIVDQGYNITGDYQTAGYNAPYVLPMFRRNEVLIPVKK
jgi:hypothetical protein